MFTSDWLDMSGAWRPGIAQRHLQAFVAVFRRLFKNRKKCKQAARESPRCLFRRRNERRASSGPRGEGWEGSTTGLFIVLDSFNNPRHLIKNGEQTKSLCVSVSVCVSGGGVWQLSLKRNLLTTPSRVSLGDAADLQGGDASPLTTVTDVLFPPEGRGFPPRCVLTNWRCDPADTRYALIFLC